MLTDTQIKDAVIMIVSGAHYTGQEVTEKSTPESLALDSLDHIEIIMAIEEEFGFEFPYDDCMALKSVGDLCAYVKRRLDKGPTP